MELMNIYGELSEGLARFQDDRGTITDIFYARAINHVNLIESSAGAVRGNHLHKLTTQHIFIIEGSLEYWYQSEEMTVSEFKILKKGDLATSKPGEIHAMKMGPNGCIFMSFSEGPRGGKDYESDTYRTDSIIRHG